MHRPLQLPADLRHERLLQHRPARWAQPLEARHRACAVFVVVVVLLLGEVVVFDSFLLLILLFLLLILLLLLLLPVVLVSSPAPLQLQVHPLLRCKCILSCPLRHGEEFVRQGLVWIFLE